MKHTVCFYALGLLLGASYIYADEQQAQFVKQVLITEAQKILQQENEQLDAEISRAPRPDSPAISHPIYPVGPLQGPQGPQGKQGPAGPGLTSCGPFKLLETAVAGDRVRLVPDTTNQLGAKAAIRKIKKGPVFDWATSVGGAAVVDKGNNVTTDCQGYVYVAGEFEGTVTFGGNITPLTSSDTDILVTKLNPVTGQFMWATRAGSTSSDRGHSIIADCSGNIYVTGEFTGTVTFGNNITLVGAGGDDIFVAKINPINGEWIWAVRAGSTGTDLGRGITTDCLGNLYITGEFVGTVAFGSTTLVSNDADEDIVVAKLDPTNGAWVWATRAGSSGEDKGNGIATDCAGNVYVVGEFENTVTFGNTITLQAPGTDVADIFVGKLDPTTGSWVWATRAGKLAGDITSENKGYGVATDCSGNVYVTGEFIGTITFGNNITLVSAGSSDIFVAKINPANGEWVWATRAGSTGIDKGNEITTNCRGDVFVTGEFSGTVTFGNSITLKSDGSPAEVFIAKIDPTYGTWVWAERVGGSSSDRGHGITTDCQGNVYVTGEFENTATFGNNITLGSDGAADDMFIAKIIDDERSLKTIGLLGEGGTTGNLRPAYFAGSLLSNVYTSLTPAADYYVDSALTVTACCCKCNCCCDANFKFMGTACSPTDLILRACC